jgi:hypothetical protein
MVILCYVYSSNYILIEALGKLRPKGLEYKNLKSRKQKGKYQCPIIGLVV